MGLTCSQYPVLISFYDSLSRLLSISSSTTGSFTLNIEEQGFSRKSAISINTGTTSGILPGPGTNGAYWYNISLSSGGYTFVLSSDSGDNFDMRVFDAAGTVVGVEFNINFPEAVSITSTAIETHSIRIWRRRGRPVRVGHTPLFAPPLAACGPGIPDIS